MKKINRYARQDSNDRESWYSYGDVVKYYERKWYFKVGFFFFWILTQNTTKFMFFQALDAFETSRFHFCTLSDTDTKEVQNLFLRLKESLVKGAVPTGEAHSLKSHKFPMLLGGKPTTTHLLRP